MSKHAGIIQKALDADQENSCIDVSCVADLFWKWFFGLEWCGAGTRPSETGVFLMSNVDSQSCSRDRVAKDKEMVLNLKINNTRS